MLTSNSIDLIGQFPPTVNNIIHLRMYIIPHQYLIYSRVRPNSNYVLMLSCVHRGALQIVNNIRSFFYLLNRLLYKEQTTSIDGLTCVRSHHPRQMECWQSIVITLIISIVWSVLCLAVCLVITRGGAGGVGGVSTLFRVTLARSSSGRIQSVGRYNSTTRSTNSFNFGHRSLRMIESWGGGLHGVLTS